MDMPTAVIVFLISVPIAWAIYLAILLQPFTSVPAIAASKETAAGHRAAALWGATFLAYVTAAVWNLLVSRVILKRYMEPRFRWVVFGFAMAAAALGLLVRKASYANEAASLSIVVQRHVPVYEVTKVGNALTAALSVVLAGTCGALMYRRRRETLNARNLRRRIALAKLSLYSSAALLVIGVVQIYFLNDWPANVFSREISSDMRQGLHGLAYTAAVVSGALYSSVLFMLYAPVLLTYDKWVSKLAEQAVASEPGVDMSKWRETQGLGRSTAGTIAEIGAVVGPWLTAVGVPQLLT